MNNQRGGGVHNNNTIDLTIDSRDDDFNDDVNDDVKLFTAHRLVSHCPARGAVSRFFVAACTASPAAQINSTASMAKIS